MTFPLSHWSRPRQTIASRLKDDDFAYALHGAHMAAEALHALDMKPSTLRRLRCLDFGCGTGRVARVLAAHFAHVTGYDPNAECIDEALRECPSIVQGNLAFTNDSSALPECDVAIAVNVLEHLDDATARAALELMLRQAPVVVVWYAIASNAAVMAPWLTAEQKAHAAAVHKAGGRIAVAVIRPEA